MSLLHLLVFSALLCLVRCECILENSDFTDPQPFFEQNGDFLKPVSPDGSMHIQTTDELVISCCDNSYVVVAGRDDITSAQYLQASCISDKTFIIEGSEVNVKNVTCKKSPDIVVKKLDTLCYDNTNILGVGYNINENFYKLYELCFDENLGQTFYSHHFVYPATAQKMAGAPNFMFIEGGLYKYSKVGIAYKRANEIKRFTKILGEGAAIDTYFNNSQYLARGHLAPRADFAIYNMQKLTYLYANVAPQWNKFNEGDWKNLEEGVRKRVKSLGRELEVYTGTYGVLTLPDENGVEQPIYLTVDDNNNDVVPVPLYFYKVVYDPKTYTATAFVSINSPYYDSDRVEKLTFCKDICDTVTQLSWVKWSSKDGVTSFCCRYSDFAKTIPYLGDLKVNGVFY